MIDFENSIVRLHKVSDDAAERSLSPLFLDDEHILGTYKSVRDFVAFTNYRIISVNVQGMTGKKKDITILPYKKVQAFSIETSGHFDLDSELELWFSSLGKVRFEFSGGSDILEIGRNISMQTL